MADRRLLWDGRTTSRWLHAHRPNGRRPAHVQFGGHPSETANRPTGPFTPTCAVRPGEQVQIDSTPLDVMALADSGVAVRADLTIAADVATRTICAAVLRPGGSDFWSGPQPRHRPARGPCEGWTSPFSALRGVFHRVRENRATAPDAENFCHGLL
jgi:hypothetical protein